MGYDSIPCGNRESLDGFGPVPRLRGEAVGCSTRTSYSTWTCVGDTVRRFTTYAEQAREATERERRMARVRRETGLTCETCVSVVAAGKAEAEAVAAHAKCHGYTHCGAHCGPCPYCQPGEDW